MQDDELRRCYYCNRIWMRGEVVVEGCCLTCGSRKFREVHRMTDAEMAELVARGYDPKEDWEHNESPLG